MVLDNIGSIVSCPFNRADFRSSRISRNFPALLNKRVPNENEEGRRESAPIVFTAMPKLV
jgi:hypothetical protein